MPLNWKSKARRIVRRVGIDVHRYRPNESIDARRRLIMDQLQIGLLLDVGANVGQYARQLRGSGYSGRIVSFEPTSHAFAELTRAASKDSLWDCFNLALGESVGEAEIGVAANSYSSSLLPMSAIHESAAPSSLFVGRETVRIECLDNLANDLGVVACDGRTLLKVDTQGFELNVLRGAKALISEIAVIENELSLIQLYEGQALYREVIDYLDGLGFGLVSLEPGFSDPRTGYLLQMDGIFVSQRLMKGSSRDYL